MTLDEAIKHCLDVAEKKEKHAKLHPKYDGKKGSGTIRYSCLRCAEEHRQLAEWLKELKELRRQTEWIPSTPDTMPKQMTEY